MAEFTEAMKAVQQLADLQQQLAAAQERAENAEASNAALKDTLLRQFRLSTALSEAAARQVGDDIVADGISATEVREVTAQVVAALNSPNPGAALLADARLGRAVRALPPEEGLHHDAYFLPSGARCNRWLHYEQHDVPGWELCDGDTPEQALGVDKPETQP